MPKANPTKSAISTFDLFERIVGVLAELAQQASTRIRLIAAP